MKSALKSKLEMRDVLIYFVLLFFIFLTIFSLYPGTGGEGGQRELAFSKKIDWWNFAPALLYGKWPSIGSNWAFSLTLVQVSIFIVATIIIYCTISTRKTRILFLLMSYPGFFFSIQLWRDSALFVLSFFAIAIIFWVETRVKFNFLTHRVFPLIFIFGASLFKPIFAPILFLTFFLFTRKFSLKQIRFFWHLSLCLFLSLFPFVVDRSLSNHFKLIKSYPEQQVMIYDSAKIYCWGYSKKSVQESKNILKPFLKNQGNFEAVCASLSPLGWDSLRVQNSEVASSPSLKVSNSKLDLNELKKGWVNLIVSSPLEWIMVKTLDISQVLVMANAFYIDGLYQSPHESLLDSTSNLFLRFLHFPILILDKLRFFSLGFAILFGVLALIRTNSFVTQPELKKAMYEFLFLNFSTLTIAAIAYIANNGRYVLPFVLLSYLFLIFKINLSEIRQVGINHQLR